MAGNNETPVASLEVIAERLNNSLDIQRDIREQMVTKDLYQGDMKSLRESISNERADRVQAVADLRTDIVSQIGEMKGDLAAVKAETAAVKEKQDNRRFTVRSGILIGLVVAFGGGLIGLIITALAAATHLAP